jgi:hypothetical protein
MLQSILHGMQPNHDKQQQMLAPTRNISMCISSECRATLHAPRTSQAAAAMVYAGPSVTTAAAVAPASAT